MTNDELVKQLMPRLESIETRLSSIETSEKEEPWHLSLASWSNEAFHTPGEIGGIVVDEGRARESDCRCIPLGEHSKLCYSHGVVGALSHDQEKLYCETYTELPASPALIERQRIMKDAAVFCQSKVQDIPEGQRLEPFLSCMSREAKKKGLEL